MKSGGGDFSAEAYQQLRDAYDKEQQRHVDDELAGTKLMGQEYGLETLPVDSPWADKIENWTYPSGKGQYLDEHQSPEEILQIMRDAAQERIDSQKEEDPDGIDEMSDEEFDKYIDKILEDAEEDESEEDGDDDEEEEGEEDDGEVEEESDEDDEEDDEPESEEDEEESEPEEVEEEFYDAEDVAAQIAELRSEIESMQFVTEPEEQSDDES